MARSLLLGLFCLFYGLLAHGQPVFMPLNRDFMAQAQLFKRDTVVRQTIWRSDLWRDQVTDGMEVTMMDPVLLPDYSRWLLQFLEPGKGLKVRVMPIIDQEIGIATRTGEGSKVANHTGLGMRLFGKAGAQLAFEGDFAASIGDYPFYVNRLIDSLQVVPGYGFARESSAGFQSSIWNAQLAWTPNKYFNIRLGQGKHFVGDGYRSLFLSDNSFSSPYLQIMTKIWKIQYINLFVKYTDIRQANGNRELFNFKYASTHLLNWNVTDNYSISVFESVVWQAQDNLNNRGFDVNYLNPVIFFRPVEFAIGSPDNALVGINTRWDVRQVNISLYGQFILDEFLLGELRSGTGWWANKFGLQLGAIYSNSYKDGLLTLQGEFNLVRPFTYTHGSVLQNFGHFNQPLAHPLGTNFREGVLIAGWQKDRWHAEYKSVLAMYGRDPDSLNLGGDIFKSYANPTNIYGNFIGQGIPSRLWHNEFRVNYVLDKSIFLRLNAGYIYRRYSVNSQPVFDNHAYIGITSLIGNRYRDF